VLLDYFINLRNSFLSHFLCSLVLSKYHFLLIFLVTRVLFALRIRLPIVVKDKEELG
jgi:hypothetical protein